MLEQQAELKNKVLRLLDEHQFMAVATLRGDGWPQATMVGYVHDDLTLYFAVALASQKPPRRPRPISSAWLWPGTALARPSAPSTTV